MKTAAHSPATRASIRRTELNYASCPTKGTRLAPAEVDDKMNNRRRRVLRFTMSLFRSSDPDLPTRDISQIAQA